MGRPRLGTDARNVTVSVKVTAREALALRDLGGSPARGLRRLIDGSLGASGRHETAGVPPRTAPEPMQSRHGVKCRIHKRWSEPTEMMSQGHKIVSKTCLDCGHVSTTTRPA